MKASNETELVEGLFFGGTSIDLGYLTERQFEEVLEIRAKLLGMGLSEGAAQVCIQKNYMTLEQVEEVKEAKSELEQAHTEQSGAVRPKNKLKLCVDRFEDRVSCEGRRHVDHARVAAGGLACLRHGAEHGQVEVCLPALARGG